MSVSFTFERDKRSLSLALHYVQSGIGELNPLLILGKDAYYRCTNPAFTEARSIPAPPQFYQG
jgi:hypothetical protein